jgi:hypothetical protein
MHPASKPLSSCRSERFSIRVICFQHHPDRSQLVEHVASDSSFTFFLMEPLLASLLDGPATISSLHEVMAEYAQESGWRDSSGEPIAADHMRWEFWPAVHPLMAVGAISGGWPSQEVAVTEFGVPTAIAILWHRAVAPRAL